MPKVLNIKQFHYIIPSGAVYVGRGNSYYGLSQSKWANPYKLISGSKEDRKRVLDQYRIWLDIQILEGKLDPEELRGKDLVCWCAPEPCHADILIELANE